MAFVRICDCEHFYAHIINENSPFGNSENMGTVKISVHTSNSHCDSVTLEMCPKHFKKFVDLANISLPDANPFSERLSRMIGGE